MLKKLLDILNTDFAYLKEARVAVAVSGGLDSMALTHALLSLDYNPSLIHCNFNLRAAESDGDQEFLEQYCSNAKIPFLVKSFNTVDYGKTKKLSTQMAARELRYTWFNQLITTKQFDYILTAHHASDSLETLLINLSRGSGLRGLAGIPAKNNHIVRPLLSFTREQILEFATQEQVLWREDSSNATNAYLRNKIRHKVIPELQEISPDFVKKALDSQEHLKQSQALLNSYIDQLTAQLVNKKVDSFYANINQIKQLSSPAGFLFEWLNPYGFTAWDDILPLLDGQSGKQVNSSDWQLLKDREQLVLSPKKTLEKTTFQIDSVNNTLPLPIQLNIESVAALTPITANQIIVDANKLEFPLTLRHWQKGDYFYPFGMQGSKKISDYFVDAKISRLEKDNIWLLCSADRIVWVVGERADDRFKVNNNTKYLLKITWAN